MEKAMEVIIKKCHLSLQQPGKRCSGSKIFWIKKMYTHDVDPCLLKINLLYVIQYNLYFRHNI